MIVGVLNTTTTTTTTTITNYNVIVDSNILIPITANKLFLLC